MVMDVEANENQQPKQERSSRNKWTASLDKVLADLVVKQIQSGNRQNDFFDRKTWSNMRNDFNKQTGLSFNNNQLRKHLDVLRQRYNSLKSSRAQNEFAMGEEDTRCLLGLDLWEEFGVQPRSEQVKVKDCAIYEQLCVIFGDDSAHGKYAQSSHFEGLEESMAENLSAPNVAEANTNLAERKRKREPDTKTSSGASQIDPAALETVAGALSDMVTALRSRMADSETQNDGFSITNCVNALDEMENVEEGVYFAALDLFENPGLRETFMSLKASNLRLTWLQVKCRKPSPSVA
uniref:Myb/SANT-like domain-containing protein n=1 Tax=Noccaea caerulescens TaxID=107243 RepID=A0A1J3JPQ0_NOCCA